MDVLLASRLRRLRLGSLKEDSVLVALRLVEEVHLRQKSVQKMSVFSQSHSEFWLLHVLAPSGLQGASTRLPTSLHTPKLTLELLLTATTADDTNVEIAEVYDLMNFP